MIVDLRTLAAAVLGVGLGVLFVAAPEAVIRVQAAGRLPRDRHGRYGEDGRSTADDRSGVASRWRWLVRGVGVALILGGLYFGWTLL
ncbi:MAG: hypothetical protein ABEK02_01395 [Haloquadratum sp.]